MELGDALGQGQAQSGAALCPGAGFIHHVERLGDAADGLRRDAPAPILHGEAVALRGAGAQQGDLAARLGGLAGIVQQVVQENLQQAPLAHHGAILHPQLQHQLALLHGVGHALLHRLGQGQGGKALHLGRLVFQGKQAQQAVGHGFQPPPLGENKAGRLKLLLLRQLPAAQGVRIADDGGQGRFQLMGEGGGEILLLLGGLLQGGDVPLQLLGHAVELGGQDADFVIGADVDPDGVVAPGDLPGRPGQIADGGHEHGAEAEARQQAHRHGDEVDQLVGAQVLPPQLIQGRHIVAAFQAVVLLIHPEGAGDHHLVYRLCPIGHPDDLVIRLLVIARRLGQPEAVVPEGGDGQGILQGLRRDLGRGAGAALHRHGAQHGAQQPGFVHSGGDLVHQLGAEHRGYNGVAADAHGQSHNEHHRQGDLGGKLHPSPSSR